APGVSPVAVEDGLCGARWLFVATAQPRCGCCDIPAVTLGSAANGATQGFGAEPALRFQEE
ncbi:MAG: hypothetical protein NTX27_10490, partial [Verrucomicrobia bacterium]|nr:hypothetical protein [Verrucomicrobiota bacterium]